MADLIFVNNQSGDDRFAVKNNPVKPYKTIKKAFGAIRSGDTVFIQATNEPYLETPQSLEPMEVIVSSPDYGAALVLSALHNVSITGVGKPIIQFTQHGNGILIRNCENLTISGLELRGKGKIWVKSECCFALISFAQSNERIKIRDNAFKYSGNHGIAHLYGPRLTNFCVFEHNVFVNGGLMNHPKLVADGAAIAVGGHDNIFQFNHVIDWLRGIEIESGFKEDNSSNNIVHRNHITGSPWQSIIITSMMRLGEVFQNNEISYNIIDGCYSALTGYPFSQTGIYIAGSINSRVIGNAVTRIKNGIGILLTSEWGETKNALISENIVSSVDRTGIQLSKATYNPPDISYPVHKCSIQNNIISDVGGRGVWLDGTDLITTGNVINGCGTPAERWEGVYIAPESQGCIDKNNFCYNSK